ncbi:MAG: hypothetical protein IKY70_06015, partial [Bacteroidales bacterium]|nr:hypothetical protein [Bacteroidales bacterium]
TKMYGGNSVSPFNGKIVTLFNTLTNERVADGVKVVSSGEPVTADVAEPAATYMARALSVDMPASVGRESKSVPITLNKLGDRDASVSVSVYNLSGIEKMIGQNGYNSTSLLERTGDFEATSDVDYAGELIKAQVLNKGNKKEVAKGSKNVYMSALNGKIDVYIATSDSLGLVKYYTNNIYGDCDLVFDIAGNVNIAKSLSNGNAAEGEYDIVLVNEKYNHTVQEIPALKISEDMHGALVARSLDMQISRRFEHDTLYNLMPMRATPLVGKVKPVVYKLDDYTRFPVMEDVIREYVKRLRVRRHDKQTDLQISVETSIGNFNFTGGNALVLLDGVPVRNHKMIVDFDPLLVKEIIIYPAQMALNNFVYGGIVEFNTYKGDMGGLQLGGNVKIIPYEGVAYPLAFWGDRIRENGEYPNYNGTIYWNPIVDIKAGESFYIECLLPAYGGEFRVVVEGIDSAGAPIYYSNTFEVKYN